MTNHLPGVYIVSDSIGETAEMVVRAAASQFNLEIWKSEEFPTSQIQIPWRKSYIIARKTAL